MTGWKTESAARLPLSEHSECSNAIVATLTFFVASVVAFSMLMPGTTLAQSSMPPKAGFATAATNAPPAPLPVDTAFPLLASFEKGSITLRVDVLPGHYLYRDRFEFSRDGETAYPLTKFKQGNDVVAKAKDDPNFGRVDVFDAPVMLNVGHTARAKTKFVVVYQGCSELAGVCYPPVKRTFDLTAGTLNVAANETNKPGLGSLFKKNASQ